MDNDSEKKIKAELTPEYIELRSRCKKAANNYKIAAKGYDAIKNILEIYEPKHLRGYTPVDPNNEVFKSFSQLSNYMKAAGAIADIYLGAMEFNSEGNWRQNAKGALYIASGILKGIEIKYSNVSVLSYGVGLLKIGRAVTDFIDISHKDYSTEPVGKKECDIAAAACTMMSGIFDIAAKIWESDALFFTTQSFVYMFAAGFFRDGDFWGGFTVLTLGTVINIAMATVFKELFKKAFASLMKLCMNAFRTAVTPLLPNPFSGIIAAALMITITILLEAALSSLFTIIGFAKGGFPAAELPFIAREAGPEIIGTLQTTQGRRTAVINNDQIVEAVARGVHNAFVTALRQQNSKSGYRARVFLNGEQIAMATAV